MTRVRFANEVVMQPFGFSDSGARILPNKGG